MFAIKSKYTTMTDATMKRVMFNFELYGQPLVLDIINGNNIHLLVNRWMSLISFCREGKQVKSIRKSCYCVTKAKMLTSSKLLSIDLRVIKEITR